MSDENIPQAFVELLQLGSLTPNEAKALLAIAITKVTKPLEVAKYSKVSHSKIYEAMNSLVDKGYLEKKDREYEFNIESLSILNNKFKQRVKEFDSFLDALSEKYPESEENIAKQLASVITNIGYSVNFNHKIDSNKEVLRRIPSPIRTRFHKFNFPWILSATSDLSGISIGIVIFSSSTIQKISSPNELFVLRGILSEYHFDHVYFLSTELPKPFKQFFSNVIHISLSEKYELKIPKLLDELDMKWRQAKQNLERLDKNTDELYQYIARLNTNLLHIKYGIKEILSIKINNDVIIKSFDELSYRLEADLKALSESHLDIKLDCKDIQSELLEDHLLPNNDEVNDIYNQTSTIKNALKFIDDEIDVLDTELLELLRGKTYKKLGFLANPFVFTIPVEDHLEIIGQRESISQLREFLTSIPLETPVKNTAFIVDNPGMGKTHLLKYFSREINNESHDSVGLFVRCRPGSDVISLHNEISIAIQQLPNSKLKTGLLAILKKTEPPSTINQLLSLLKNLSQFSYDLGIKGFILFLDEFENLLTSGIQLSSSVAQLERLLHVPHVGFVIVVRKDYWKKIHKMKNFVNESSYELIQLSPFDYTSTEKLLNKRLSDYSIDNEVKIKFSKPAIEKITKQSDGNIRKIITLARDAFSNAINSDQKIIGPEFVIETQTTLDDIRHNGNSVTELHDLKGGEKLDV